MTDTIAAVSTAPGRGGVGVVRVSGPAAASVAARIAGDVPPARTASLREFRDDLGRIIDKGLVLYLPAPASYTGEDTVELQGHGAPAALEQIVRTLVSHGARRARAGEFTERAFLNGRLDLAQAEAVADLIESSTEASARAAMRALQGELSTRVHALADEMLALRVQVEASIDFADDGIDPLGEEAVATRLRAAHAHVRDTLSAARQGLVLRDGVRVALVGRPNVGKSSLLNRLAGDDLAIVTEVPGTTRDVIRAHVEIDGVPMHVLDTAGFRPTTDRVEQAGIERARKALETADIALLVMEANAGMTDEDRALVKALPPTLARLLVFNKIDLEMDGHEGIDAVPICALTGEGIDALRSRLVRAAGVDGAVPEVCSARARHVEALETTDSHLAAADALVTAGREAELVAEELRLAGRALGEITGEVTTEDLLGRIFSTFCVGK